MFQVLSQDLSPDMLDQDLWLQPLSHLNRSISGSEASLGCQGPGKPAFSAQYDRQQQL